jgi:phosphopantothenoylcysteine decarboxylase/phosphopantothenate--cysteine ligase
MLKGKTIGLCVTGSIAAYKAIYLVRLLTEAGADVRTVLTRGATRFVGAMSFSALSGHRAITDMWSAAEHGEIGHVELSHNIDALIIAPATADTLARLAQGRANDPVCALALSTQAPILICPAMEDGMWHHPATQSNVALLRERGAQFLSPTQGALASGRSGSGRMAEPVKIAEKVSALLGPGDLVGVNMLVTAGPTREHIDPARFLSNPSTGRMGIAIAEAARDRGANVTLVLGPTALDAPDGMEIIAITSTQDMLEACEQAFKQSDVWIMAAAPADYRPAQQHEHKVKKTEGDLTTLELEKTQDILGSLESLRSGQFIIGFAAETRDVLGYAREKLKRKKLDMIVANDISGTNTGFASSTNAVTLIVSDGSEQVVELAPKREIAEAILSLMQSLRTLPPSPRPSVH